MWSGENTVVSVFALLMLVNAASAEQKKLKVYISADMEGVDGVVTWDVQGMPKGREYEEFRRVMTQEVNAAIAGAFKAGATEVLVSDDHHDSQNLDLELLDPSGGTHPRWSDSPWDDAGYRYFLRCRCLHRLSRE